MAAPAASRVVQTRQKFMAPMVSHYYILETLAYDRNHFHSNIVLLYFQYGMFQTYKNPFIVTRANMQYMYSTLLNESLCNFFLCPQT
jgi:hypothetical protein